MFGINRIKPEKLLLNFEHCDTSEGDDRYCVMVGRVEKDGDISVINNLYDEDARDLYNKLIPRK